MEIDYLVIGAGAMGLGFADELLTRTDAHITLVDKRHAPGGHWNDAYSFVRLHQPSIFYGVESKELTEYRIDASGPNQGFLSLAEGPEILSYFHGLMRDRLLASGRVRFLPMCEIEADGSVRSLLSRERHAIVVRKKIVDASYQPTLRPSSSHLRISSSALGISLRRRSRPLPSRVRAVWATRSARCAGFSTSATDGRLLRFRPRSAAYSAEPGPLLRHRIASAVHSACERRALRARFVLGCCMPAKRGPLPHRTAPFRTDPGHLYFVPAVPRHSVRLVIHWNRLILNRVATERGSPNIWRYLDPSG